MQNHFRKRERRNTATDILFPEKSNAENAAQAMLPDTKPERTAADIRRGVALRG